MKKFIFRSAALLALTYALLLLTHMYVVNVINKEDFLPEPCQDYVFSNKDFNWIWIGNSRTFVHVDQNTFNNDSISSYSLVQDGGSVDLIYYKLKNYLRRNNPPDVIFLQVDYSMAVPEFNEFVDIRPSQFFNWNSKKYLLKHYNWVEKIYFYIPGIAFDLKTIVKTIFRIDEHIYFNGFYPVDKEFGYQTDLDWEHKFTDSTFNLAESNYIDSIVNKCKQYNVRCALWIPPSSLSLERAWTYSTSFNTMLTGLESKYAVDLELIDCRDTLRFKDQECFYNHTHLNKFGVNSLSKLLLNNITQNTYFSKGSTKISN